MPCERKKLMRERMINAPVKVKLIKIADRLDNVLSINISNWDIDKKLKYIEESELLIESLTKNLVDDKYSKLVETFALKLAKDIKNIKEQLKP